MTLRYFSWAVILVGYTVVLGQQQDQRPRERQEQEQQRQQQQQEQRRPTLGPPPEPSLSGPRSSTTTDPRKLLRIQKIFIEPIDNLLSEKLASGLSKMGRFRLVTQRNEADAVLRGTCFDSRRLKTLHSEVYINDRVSGASIWQDIVRRPFNPPLLAKAVDDTAVRVLADLGGSIQEAQHK